MVLLIDSLLAIYIFNIPTVHNVLFVKSCLLKGEVKPRKQMDRRGKQYVVVQAFRFKATQRHAHKKKRSSSGPNSPTKRPD